MQHELKGNSASEIVAMFPSVSVAQVHAALAYYYDNKAEIDSQMKSAEDIAASVRNQIGVGPLARKLAKADHGDSASS